MQLPDDVVVLLFVDRNYYFEPWQLHGLAGGGSARDEATNLQVLTNQSRLFPFLLGSWVSAGVITAYSWAVC